MFNFYPRKTFYMLIIITIIIIVYLLLNSRKPEIYKHTYLRKTLNQNFSSSNNSSTRKSIMNLKYTVQTLWKQTQRYYETLQSVFKIFIILSLYFSPLYYVNDCLVLVNLIWIRFSNFHHFCSQEIRKRLQIKKMI